MNRVFQTKFGDGSGNCFAACLASLFPVTLDDVPDFYLTHRSGWYDAFTGWVSRFGVVPLMFDAERHTPHLPVHYLIGGVSPRGIMHSVIGFGTQGMVHDPHPDGLGVEKIVDYTYFVSVLQNSDPMANHQCRRIATVPMTDDRECWLGELLEPILDHPQEKFCLHIKTPYKQVVFGLDGHGGDAGVMAVLAQIIHGKPFNPHWLERQERHYTSAVQSE